MISAMTSLGPDYFTDLIYWPNDGFSMMLTYKNSSRIKSVLTVIRFETLLTEALTLPID